MGGEVVNRRSATAIDCKIGARIRSLRLASGMSQEGLAELIRVTFQQVQKYEKGVNRVAASTLLEIAAALGVSPMDLLPAASAKGADADASILDDVELAPLARQVAKLNTRGRKTLTSIARSMADDPEFLSRKRRD